MYFDERTRIDFLFLGCLLGAVVVTSLGCLGLPMWAPCLLVVAVCAPRWYWFTIVGRIDEGDVEALTWGTAALAAFGLRVVQVATPRFFAGPTLDELIPMLGGSAWSIFLLWVSSANWLGRFVVDPPASRRA